MEWQWCGVGVGTNSGSDFFLKKSSVIDSPGGVGNRLSTRNGVALVVRMRQLALITSNCKPSPGYSSLGP